MLRYAAALLVAFLLAPAGPLAAREPSSATREHSLPEELLGAWRLQEGGEVLLIRPNGQIEYRTLTDRGERSASGLLQSPAPGRLVLRISRDGSVVTEHYRFTADATQLVLVREGDPAGRRVYQKTRGLAL